MKKINLQSIQKYLLNKDLSEHQHVQNIKLISNNFTSNRNEIKIYVMNEDLVSSYALYYLPTNVPKFDFIFSKLPENIKETILNNHFIDIGSGPGTYSYAVSQIGHRSSITCVDTSTQMLKQAEKILTNTFQDKEFHFKRDFLTKDKNATLFFGNSINEMGVQNAIDLVNVISPEVVMFIEPGTSELFKELKSFRSWLIPEYDVVYPCPSNTNCPNNWCHQVLRTTHELDVERLSQLVSLDRKIMPLTAHVYIKKKNLVQNEKCTLIQFLNETKFSFIYEVCGLDNNENKNFKIEILKKNLSKEQEKYFKNASIGDQINFVKEKFVADVWRGHVN